MIKNNIKVKQLCKTLLVAIVSLGTGTLSAQTINLDMDLDNDGILNTTEGYCRFIEAIDPIYYNAGSAFDPAITLPTFVGKTNLLHSPTTVNPNGGGAGRTDLSFTLDATGSVQVRYNGAYNYYNLNPSWPSGPLTSVYNNLNTTLIVSYRDTNDNWRKSTAPFSGILSSGDRYYFQPYYISEVAGKGTLRDPWRVKVQFYIDMNTNLAYDSTRDVMITQINTYVAGDNFFRRDFEFSVPNGAPEMKIYDLRDAAFTGTTDAGLGIYATTGVDYKTGGATEMTTQPTLIGITDRGNSGIFLGFMPISPWKSWTVGQWGQPTTPSNTGANLNNTILNEDGDIGFTIQYNDIPANSSGETQKYYYSGYEVVGLVTNLCKEHRDTDSDGTPDYLDLDSDADGCWDAVEGAGNITSDMLNTDGSIAGNADIDGIPVAANGGQGEGTAYIANPTLNKGTASPNQTIQENTTPQALTITGFVGNIQWQIFSNGNYTNIANATTGTYQPGELSETTLYRAIISSVGGCTDYHEIIITISDACYEDPNNDTSVEGLPTKHGITLLKRAGNNDTEWPRGRKAGHTVLESNTKGLIITRMTTEQIEKIANPQEGMMVYDNNEKCLKIFADNVWKCFSVPSCP
ncbi:MAG: hypothetical protein Q4G16_09835 [Cruoricaptor ignavus]|nr:hypothetical protein [Cruoricaptor ignavus]